MKRKSSPATQSDDALPAASRALLASRCPWLAVALEASPNWTHPATEFMTALQFEVRTLVDGRLILPFLARFFPDPARAALGLHELLSNAIEHGNLEIGGAEKARQQASNTYDRLLACRQAETRYRSRRVTLYLQRLDERVEVTIADQGQGFVWQPYLAADAVSANEHGLAVVRHQCFDGLSFEGRGNIVRAWSLH